MADGDAAGITSDEVARWPIVGMTASEVRIVTFTLPAGAHVPVHDHGGWQFVYVLEGTVVSTLRGQPPSHYDAGQAFYIPRHHPHLDFGNDGASEARVLAFYLTDPGVEMVSDLSPPAEV